MGGDTSGAAMDHSGHNMSGSDPDTTGAMDHEQMDHSRHEMSGMKPDTVAEPDTTVTGYPQNPREEVRGGRGL
jgi:hypothetical protein